MDVINTNTPSNSVRSAVKIIQMKDMKIRELEKRIIKVMAENSRARLINHRLVADQHLCCCAKFFNSICRFLSGGSTRTPARAPESEPDSDFEGRTIADDILKSLKNG